MAKSSSRNPGRPKKRTKRAKVIVKWKKRKEEQKREALEVRSPPREPSVTANEYEGTEPPNIVDTTQSPQPGPSGSQFRRDVAPTLSTYRNKRKLPSHGQLEKTPKRRVCKTTSAPPLYRANSPLDDVGWVDADEALPELIVETTTNSTQAITGRRIVDIAHLSKELLKLGEHPRFCTTGKYVLVGEIKVNGLHRTLKFHCSNCNRYSYVNTDGDKGSEVNDHLVWGATAIGSGYYQMRELLAILDIPFMTELTYKKSESKVFETWELHLNERMKSAGKAEKEIAIAKGNVHNGVAFIMVIGDGGWCTRTYGHSFRASAGVACIIGEETKQLLFVGVRNKYCYVCSRSEKSPTVTTPEHKCFKNYAGPSTGMETEIIIEGFNRSEEQHNLQYKYYIGDGDSSVYPRIKKSVSYGRSVVKVECANHVVRCYTSKLHVLKKNTKYDSSVRTILSDKLPRLTTAARSAIRQAAEHQDVRLLQEDLRNGPRHVFGDHSRWRSSQEEESTTHHGYCKRKDDQKEPNYVLMMEECDMMKDVLSHLDYVVKKADTLRFNKTNNQAERFNSMVAKLIGGKRVDHAKRGGYRGRIFGAGLAHSSGPSWHLSPLKRLTGRSPGKITKKEFERRQSKSAASTRRRLAAGPVFKKKTSTGPDREYGPLAAEVDLPDDVLAERCQDFLKKLQTQVDSLEKQDDLQKRTTGQSDCALWRELRQDRLTASNFGTVVQRRPTTSCHKLVERLLYNTYDLTKNRSIIFGRQHEQTAILKYQAESGRNVLPCGLFIDVDHPYLGASPDGLINDNGIIEVKTVPSIDNKTITEALSSKVNFCLEKQKDGNIQLKRKHKYYYQVQGQLAIAKRSHCDFIVYASNAYFVERIYPDNELWTQVMLPKLQDFYLQFVLPELVDPRVPRGLKIREPPAILEARVEQQHKKQLASDKKTKRAEAKKLKEITQHQKSKTPLKIKKLKEGKKKKCGK